MSQKDTDKGRNLTKLVEHLLHEDGLTSSKSLIFSDISDILIGHAKENQFNRETDEV